MTDHPAGPIPLPARIHYETLLRILEQQTTPSLSKTPHKELTHDLIMTLRKALSQQRLLETLCEQDHLTLDYRWSVEQATPLIRPNQPQAAQPDAPIEVPIEVPIEATVPTAP
jgi:hypothetical protein